MNDQPQTGEARPESKQSDLASAESAPDSVAKNPTSIEPAVGQKLTAEEQMALFEKDLKENDWGHQPC